LKSNRLRGSFSAATNTGWRAFCATALLQSLLDMGRHKADGPSQRQLRVGEELRHALAAIFERGELHDPLLASRSITVTEARMSPDLRHATFFVTPLGGEEADSLLRALAHARGFLRHRLAETVTLKYAPDVSFRIDTSFAEAGRIASLLNSPQVARDLAPHADIPHESLSPPRAQGDDAPGDDTPASTAEPPPGAGR
jgi:ribosome-binding factor A